MATAGVDQPAEDRLRDVAEVGLARGVMTDEAPVRVALGLRHDVAGADRLAIRQVRRTGRPEQIARRNGIDRDGAVEALPGCALPHVEPQRGGVREVRAHVRVLPQAGIVAVQGRERGVHGWRDRLATRLH